METNNKNNRIVAGGGSRNEAISFIRLLSLLMIISCHIMQYYDIELAWWFNVGVQIFLCISGFLYGQKNINNTTDFYNKRLKKILIPYYLVFIPFGMIEFIFARDVFDIKDFAKGLVLYSTIEGAGHLWFIPTILMCYFITPLLQDYRDKYITDKKAIVNFFMVGIITTSVVIQGFTNFTPAWICCYVIGYVLGINKKNGYIGEKTLVLITGIIAIAGNAIQIYCDYIANIDFTGFGTIKNYNHVMLGVFIFMLLKLVFEGIDLTGIGKLLNLSDEYSFEMYLVHQLLILGPFSLLALTGNVMVNILIMLFSICTLTLLLKKVEKAVNRMAP